MGMKLYLLRHGVAVDRGDPNFPDDAARPLTEEGLEKVRQVAKGMQRLDLRFDVILSSPLVRAKQTAEEVAKAFRLSDRLSFSAHLADEDGNGALIGEIDSLRPRPDRLLLVGHEPNLSELMALLISGDAALPVRFKKAGLACLSVNGLVAGPCAVLEWLLAPKQLRLLA